MDFEKRNYQFKNKIMLENKNINEPQNPAFLVGAVISSGNPWFNIKCEDCKQQILSYRNLGLASYFTLLNY